MTRPHDFTPDYTINRDTYLLQSIRHGQKNHTLVYEKRGIFHVPKKSLKLVDNACKSMGSSYRTATERAKQLLADNKHKLPIVIGVDSGYQPYIMFPLYSPRSEHNIWIAYNAVTNIMNHKTHVTVTFKDKIDINLPVLISSFNNQYVTAAMLFKAVYKDWHRFNPPF
ncbi:competence protein ComK [Lysinibacillus sp. LZ02]|uniref:competence protein ComK n=1 Tax=Lysinibacillus sp. LZ02 TaxID=3420668 RepID=UPI003D36D333